MFLNVWHHAAQNVRLRCAWRHILGRITNHFAVFLSPYEGARSQRLGLDSAALEKGRTSCACSVNSVWQDERRRRHAGCTTLPPTAPGRTLTPAPHLSGFLTRTKSHWESNLASVSHSTHITIFKCFVPNYIKCISFSVLIPFMLLKKN